MTSLEPFMPANWTKICVFDRFCLYWDPFGIGNAGVYESFFVFKYQGFFYVSGRDRLLHGCVRDAAVFRVGASGHDRHLLNQR